MRGVRAGMAVAAGIALAGTLGLWARYVEPRRLEVTFHDTPGLNHGLTIAFVTDLHIGPHTSARSMEPTVRALASIRPDYILFGGDFISESPRYLHDLETPLRRMVSTATKGCYGIWGNHDVANIRARVAPVLETAGVTMLTDEAVALSEDLWLAGIDDFLLGRPNPEAAFSQVPAGARSVALWHEPDLAERLLPYSPTLILSGHTHGGQMRLPFIGALATPKLGKRYVAGWFNVQGMPLYVSRGIGMYRPPLRLNCRPELAIFRI